MKNINLCSNRSQMKVQEMIFMLLGLAIFFILILLLYVTFSMSSVQNTVKEKSRDDAVLLASRLAGSPELGCVSGISGSAVCVDADKLIALTYHPDYQRFWDINSLRIERVYPYEGRTIPCIIENYPNCNSFVIIKNKSSSVEEYSSFVTLCRKESIEGLGFYDKCELGKIVVTPKVVKGT